MEKRNFLKDLVDSKPHFTLDHTKCSLNEWWSKEGWQALNNVLIALYGCSASWVCLENVMDIPTDIRDYDQDAFIQMMRADGADVYVKNVSGTNTLCLNLQN